MSIEQLARIKMVPSAGRDLFILAYAILCIIVRRFLIDSVTVITFAANLIAARVFSFPQDLDRFMIQYAKACFAAAAVGIMAN